MTALCGITLVYPERLATLVGQSKVAPYIRFVPLLFLLQSLDVIAMLSCTREKKFGTLAIANFVSANSSRLVFVILGLTLGGSALFLLLGRAMGAVLALAVTAWALRSTWITHNGDEEKVSLSVVAKKYARFPGVQLWTTVLAGSGNSLPTILLAQFFPGDIIGFFEFGRRLLLQPVFLFSKSLGLVFYPLASREWHERGTMSRTFVDTTRLVCVSCTIPLGTIGFLGPHLFEVFFGTEWREAGLLAQILTPWICLYLLFWPVSSVYLVRHHEHALFIYSLAQVVLGLGSVALGALVTDHRIVIGCLSLSGSLCAGIGFVFAGRLAVAPICDILRMVLVQNTLAVCALLPAAISYWALHSISMTWNCVIFAFSVWLTNCYVALPEFRRKVERLLGLNSPIDDTTEPPT